MDYILLFKILGWVIVLFNFYTIFLLWKSNIFKKWWRMLLPILLNFLTLIYSQYQGWFFKIFQFQFLGYIGSQKNYQLSTFEDVLLGESVLISFPIGALIVFYKLENWKRFKEQVDEGI